MRTSLLRPVCRNASAAFLVLATLLLAASGGTVSLAQGPAKGPTVWDGVYTEAQAARATSVFGASCSNCHSLAPDGTGNRPLSGERFWQRNTQKSVGELLAFVSKNMPNGAAAGSLAPATYNDLVALILKSNGLPTGMTELTPETAAGVQIVSKDGPGELPANTLVRVVGCLARNGSDWVLTSATAPARVDKTDASPEDATRPLGEGTVTLKFVLTRLDSFLGQRMAVAGMLMGAGGVDGINVATVNRVADKCP
jgi:mono/diheme cytochrome c family protein